MTFQSLGLSAELLRAIADEGYDQPTPVQQQAIPAILEGRDVLAAAQTGTGKTAAFVLPILQRLGGAQKLKAQRPIRVLVLTPTRELAAQVAESVSTYGRYAPVTSTVVFGGVNINPQIQTLRRGVDVLIATPGRLLDHVSQRTVDLRQVEILVLDEADRMLDMGFIRDIRRIIGLLPATRQNLLFSATFSDDIRTLADGILQSPARIEVAPRNSTAEGIEQVVHPVEKSRKRELLSYLIGSRNWEQVLVFTRTKHGANRLAEQLEQDGLETAAIHGNKSQGARTRALADFKAGRVRVLVATDIAARGLDIDQLPHVVNYELPNVPEDYVHRIGRTGRAGAEGAAVSLVCADESAELRAIERLLKREIRKEVIDGYAARSTPRSPDRGQDRDRPRHSRSSPQRHASSDGQRRHHDGGHRNASGNRSSSGNRSGSDNRSTSGSGNRPTSNSGNRSGAGSGSGRRSFAPNGNSRRSGSTRARG
jgi:ATP-dependent RNA helicase RhlE